MGTSNDGNGRYRHVPVWQGRLWGRSIARIVLIAFCLAALPVDLRLTSDSRLVGFSTAEAMADGRGNGNSNGNGNNDRDRDRGNGGNDRDRDRGNSGNDRDQDRGNGNNDRDRDRGNGNNGRADRTGGNGRGGSGTSASDQAGSPRNRSVTAGVSTPAATAGRSLVERSDGPVHAPTEAGTARTRAMVEIAKELGAIAPDPRDHSPISGPVTQEMLDVAEETYVAAVQEAWEAHGFPWNDPDVIGSLAELEALVSTLETIMDSAAPNPDSRSAVTVAPDINNDGFVDINDLWDAHLQ